MASSEKSIQKVGDCECARVGLWVCLWVCVYPHKFSRVSHSFPLFDLHSDRATATNSRRVAEVMDNDSDITCMTLFKNNTLRHSECFTDSNLKGQNDYYHSPVTQQRLAEGM